MQVPAVVAVNAIIMTTLTIATITDYKSFKIPNYITYPLIIVGVVSLFWLSWQIVLTRIGVALALLFFSRSSGGDKKLLVGMSLLSGATSALVTYLISGCLAGLSIILRNYRYTRSLFPYGIKYEFGYDVNMGGFFLFAYMGFFIMRYAYGII